jgi:hypothetical protein
MKPLDANDYVNIIRKKLFEKGTYAVRNLLLHFRKIDVNNSIILTIAQLIIKVELLILKTSSGA